MARAVVEMVMECWNLEHESIEISRRNKVKVTKAAKTE
jgi:hypothetical protein